MGNATRDPELRVTPKGTSICQFGLAVKREWKDESGQKREEVLFIDCESWGKAGDIIAKYMFKGRPLFVEGRLKLEQWEDKTSGAKRSRIKVVVENFQFIGGRVEENDTTRAEAAKDVPGRETTTMKKPTMPGDPPDEESVPF